MGKFGGLEVGVGTSGVLEHKSGKNSFERYHSRPLLVHSAVEFACRPSVSPSVRLSDCDVGGSGVGWKSWKLIVRSIRPTPLLFIVQRPSTLSQGNMGKF